MARFGFRDGIDWLALAGALIATAGCSTQAGQPAQPAETATRSPAGSGPDVIGVELPAGEGRALMLNACLECHDLGGLNLFRNFYTRDDWRTLVLTMRSHGAAITPDEADIITDYLATYFTESAQ